MPTAGLNHDNDVKQSKKTTARLHKDCMESKKECMAINEPPIIAPHVVVFPVHEDNNQTYRLGQQLKEEQHMLMDPSTEGADMTQVKLKVVVFHDSVDKSELPTYSTEDNDTFIDVLHNVNIMPGLDSLNLVAYRRG